VIEKERERHRKRKAFLEHLQAHLDRAEQLLRRARRDLGSDDPVTSRLEAVVSSSRSAVDTVSAFVEKGNVIEDF
jgi:hypothetical protein